MPKWLQFDRRVRTEPSEPNVGIQKDGILFLNRAAVEALGSPAFVELLYDPEERLIGIKPAQNSSSTYPLRRKKQGSGSSISGQGLLRRLGVDTSRAFRCPARLIDGVLTIDLKSAPPSRT